MDVIENNPGRYLINANQHWRQQFKDAGNAEILVKLIIVPEINKLVFRELKIYLRNYGAPCEGAAQQYPQRIGHPGS